MTVVHLGLGPFDINSPVVELVYHAWLDCNVYHFCSKKIDEAEATSRLSLQVEHRDGIRDLVVSEEGLCPFFQLVGSGIWRQPSDEDLACHLLFEGLDYLLPLLHCELGLNILVVDTVRLRYDHLCIPSVLEGYEAESSGHSCSAVVHDHNICHVSKVLKVLTQGSLVGIPRESPNE